MPHCNKCGSEIQANVQFCPKVRANRMPEQRRPALRRDDTVSLEWSKSFRYFRLLNPRGPWPGRTCSIGFAEIPT